MKTFIASLLTFASVSAFACNPEAMFIGKVRNLTTTTTGYSFQVKIGNYFSPSGVCPMWEPELENAVIFESGVPSIQDGDAISGVMVLDETTGLFRIE